MDKNEVLKSLTKSKDLSKLGIEVSFAVETPPVTFVSSGNLALDWALSGRIQGGGFPVGRIVELFGEPSAGKSLVLAHIFAECQKMGGIAILDDSENTHDPVFMSKMGVNCDELIVLNAVNEKGQKTIEAHIKAAYEIIKTMRDKGFTAPIVLGLDSIAGLSTEHEVEAELDKQDMARAKQIRKVLRLYAPTFSKMDVLYIVTNHTSATMDPNPYAPKVTTSGGGGPKFWASVRVLVQQRKRFKDDHDQVVGCEVVAKVEKTKMTSPFRKVIMQLSYDKGISRLSGLFEVLQLSGDVVHSGAGWYYYKNNRDKKLREDQIMEIVAAEYGKGADISFTNMKEESAEEVEVKGFVPPSPTPAV